MSTNQDYFPPTDLKYHWNPKALTYSPWTCTFWDYWPAGIRATVDKIDDMYKWNVFVYNFHGEREIISGKAKDATIACLNAEKEMETQKALIWLPWMELAIRAGWRTPL